MIQDTLPRRDRQHPEVLCLMRPIIPLLERAQKCALRALDPQLIWNSHLEFPLRDSSDLSGVRSRKAEKSYYERDGFASGRCNRRLRVTSVTVFLLLFFMALSLERTTLVVVVRYYPPPVPHSPYPHHCYPQLAHLTCFTKNDMPCIYDSCNSLPTHSFNSCSMRDHPLE